MSMNYESITVRSLTQMGLKNGRPGVSINKKISILLESG